MKYLFGSPGKVSGLVLRMGQCLFAAASLAVMASASGFTTATSFWYTYIYIYI
ncbi:putative casparian strip membrane protein [Helianthus anomalus]